VRIIVIVLFLALAGLWLYELVKAANSDQRRRATYWAVSLVLTAVLVLVVVRFGVHWLALVAAGAFTLLRRLFPFMIRFLPFASRAYRNKKEQAQGSRPSSAGKHPGRMTRAEALEILGLEEGATREQVVNAYKALIKKVHPDVPGGSTYLAQQVNQAKSVLLQE
jgi:hypothetical protein